MSTANPYNSIANRLKWGVIKVDGKTQFPGIVQNVSGIERPIEWVTQYAIGTGGSAKIYKGRKLVEGCTITCSLPTKASVDEADAFFQSYVKTPKGQRGKAHKIDNPAFASIEMTQFVFTKEPAIMPAQANGSFIVTYTIDEYEKMTIAPVGQADPAKLDDPPKPADKLEQALQESLKNFNNAMDGK
jgi:hypothetical protein